MIRVGNPDFASNGSPGRRSTVEHQQHWHEAADDGRRKWNLTPDESAKKLASR
jgi:hypothetical protein